MSQITLHVQTVQGLSGKHQTQVGALSVAAGLTFLRKLSMPRCKKHHRSLNEFLLAY